VNRAFLAGDYPLALDLVSEIIRINAETHQAWTTLASIFGEMGEVDKKLSAMVYAAHLRPMDVPGWLQCAAFALDTLDSNEAEHLHTARLCFSAALRADRKNLDARLGKADICHRQGHLGEAIKEYSNVLKHRPNSLDVVRKLAEACIDNKHTESAVNTATAAYRAYFNEIARGNWEVSIDSLWHDVGIYVELFASNARYEEAISELKSLARWLVGRSSEKYWDEWKSDDREWDSESDRRSLVPQFAVTSSDPMLYGPSLPSDLRIRLAIYRLGLGEDEEAFVGHLSVPVIGRRRVVLTWHLPETPLLARPYGTPHS
jgi:general transcription factor 3C polypeptide 3 (transcription factor C subunit 4)